MSMDATWGNNSLEDLLTAGREAFVAGDHEEAHNLLRAAAVANPYDERVWTSLLEVLTQEEDREVCLENIIAINPLNPDARRQLRALRRDRRVRDEPTMEVAQVAAPKKRRTAPAKPVAQPPRRTRAAPRQEPERGVLARAILTGILIGLFAVLIGIIASVIVFGGVLNLATFGSS